MKLDKVRRMTKQSSHDKAIFIAGVIYKLFLTCKRKASGRLSAGAQECHEFVMLE